MTNVKAGFVSLLLILAGEGCGPASDAISSAQAEQGAASSVYGAAHSDIPASAGDGQVYEYH